MWTFLGYLSVALVSFGLGTWVWPMIVGEEKALREEIAYLRDRLSKKGGK